MDTPVLVSIIIAVIAIIPGMWALISQGRKNNIDAKMDMMRTVQNTAYNIIPPLQEEIHRLKAKAISLEMNTPKEEGLFKKMYENPVIVFCKHCKSANVVTSLECIKCGAPIGD